MLLFWILHPEASKKRAATSRAFQISLVVKILEYVEKRSEELVMAAHMGWLTGFSGKFVTVISCFYSIQCFVLFVFMVLITILVILFSWIFRWSLCTFFCHHLFLCLLSIYISYIIFVIFIFIFYLFGHHYLFLTLLL